MICLYSDVGQGYLTTIGNNYPNFIVQITDNLPMATVPNQRSMVFQVQPKLTYAVASNYNKMLIAKHKLQQSLDNDKEQLEQLEKDLSVQKIRQQVEIQTNDAMIKNSRGMPVIYGVSIQLLHVQSGQYVVMTSKSAEKDKTCQMIELSDTPSASRVAFQIQPRYRYRQEGDLVVYNDQILLYNLKNNCFIQFTDQIYDPILDESVQSEFRPASPKRRRNPENLFKWYEANVSQNFQKWQIISYRQTDEPNISDFELHGGDVVRLKHAESGGYITVDDMSQMRNGLQEAYVRLYSGEDENETETSNQLFELETTTGQMMDSGKVLSWVDDPETGKQICKVHLRHYNSGRLLQVTYFKDESNLGQVVTLANSSGLEEDGGNIYGKKILTKGGKIQNFIFNLNSRSMVNDKVRTLNIGSVCNLGNAGTKLYLSISLFQAEEEEEEDEMVAETEEEKKQRDFEEVTNLAQPRERKKLLQSQLHNISQNFEREKQEQQKLLNSQQKEAGGTEVIEVKKEDEVFRDNGGAQKDTISQQVLTLKTKGSMNDVFLPIKADLQQIRDVSFAHSAVPRIKLYLINLRKRASENLNLPFFISLMELLKGIIYWILEIDLENYQNPFKCEGYPNKFRQKVMRETRLLDLLIDCLIYPFATKMYQYDDLTQQHPITRICQLVYRILKHSVKENNINKNYVAQWIDLFFNQAMVTTEKNTFFAEQTITELLDNNKQLLDTQIEESTIVGLINLCLNQPKHERFLILLKHLCSCNGQAVATNQDAIGDTMFKEGNESKKEGMICQVNSVGNRHIVTIVDNVENKSELKINMEELYSYFNEKKDFRLYNYFQSLIDLMAVICMERNYKCIKQLLEIYNLEMVIDCTLNQKLEYPLRARFARLLITLHMDKDPLEKQNVPIMTRVWDDIEDQKIELPCSTNIPQKLIQLKSKFENILRETKGYCKVYKKDFNQFLLESLNIIYTMMGLGFYDDEKDIKTLAECLVSLLDGSLDFYTENEEEQHRQQIAQSEEPDSYQPLIKTMQQHQLRYKKTIENEAIVAIKNKIIDIFVKIMDIQDNKRLSIFLIEFSKFDKGLTSQQTQYLQLQMKINMARNPKQFDKQVFALKDTAQEICGEINKWVVTSFAEKNLDLAQISKQDFIAILLDLNLYQNSDLAANAFKLLLRNYTQKAQVLSLATEVQVLQDAEEIAVLEQCSIALRQMKKDAESAEFWMGLEETKHLKEARSFIDRLSAITDLCVYRENRVIDLGNKKPDKRKKKQAENEEAEFQFLNLSEFNLQWDDEDKRILTDYDIFDEQNQRLLRNLHAYEISIQIIGQKQLKTAKNKNSYLKVVEKAYIFLIKFIKDNKENQNIVLEYMELFLEDIELGVHALELITEIFRDSENLLTYNLIPLIKKIATDIDLLDIETTKKATLLSFVSVFMFYKDKCLKDNQYLILNEFTSQTRKNSNYLFVQSPESDGHEELQIYMAEMKQQYFEFMNDERLMAEIDVPPEVSYTITYIQLISFACQGKNANCETRAQAVFPVNDVIENMKIADFCYPLKSALMFFLQNVYFDVEKEVTEDFTKVVWKILDIVAEDLLKFTEVMQRSKRAAGGGGSAPARGAANSANVTQDLTQEFDNTFNALVNLKVNANKNFTFNTAFGKFAVSELMIKYVFEFVFPSLEAFLNLRLPMNQKLGQEDLVQKILKLLFLSVPYKTKPIHDRNIQKFVKTISTIPALQELGGDVNLAALGISDGEEVGQKFSKIVQISQAQKLKIFLKMTRSDTEMETQLVKEFEQLIYSIIYIPKKTNEAFKGANTIKVKDFIESLIKSTDTTSEIPTVLRTQSLKIIRKVIESENQAKTTSAIEWESEDFAPYLQQIIDAQNMLTKMDLVRLLCRIISFETRREIKEEAFNVCIATLIGGNEVSQMKFHEYIQEDIENEFINAVLNLMQECFEIIKKNQTKRNVKNSKIISLNQTLAEMLEKNVEEDDEELMKLEEQKRSLEDEMKDTDYIPDELRDGEEMTLSRALENLERILRFIQLTCENHNPDMQQMLNEQTNAEGRIKPKSVNLVQFMARMFEQMLKVINSVTVGLGQQLLDTIVESVQGPCKNNQKTLVGSKILDSCREYINMLSKSEQLTPLGFVSNEDAAEDDDKPLEQLDEFIQKIATMLVSLLEGEQDLEILGKMAFSLTIEDIKDRMLNVFGTFIYAHRVYPSKLQESGQTPDKVSLSQVSKENSYKVLESISLNKIRNHLNRDSFEGSITEAFEIFILIQNIAEGVPSCAKYKSKDFYTPDQQKAYEFLRQNTGCIEVSIKGQLQRVYFPIRPICDFISIKTRKSLMENVDRESQQTKVAGLMEATPQLIDEMRHNEALQSAPIKITPNLMAQLKDFSNIVGLFISLSQLFFLTRVNNYRDVAVPDFIKLIILILGIIQGTSSLTLIVFYTTNKYALVTKAGWRRYVKSNKGKMEILPNDTRLKIEQMSVEQTHLILMCKGPEADEFNISKDKTDYGNFYTAMEVQLFNIYFFLQDTSFQYYVLYFGISVLGFLSNELYYSFHLLDVIQKYPTLSNVTKAVTMNAEQLIMTFGLNIVLMYIYATILFFYIMETSYDFTINPTDADQVGLNHCRSMLECVMYVIYIGFLKGGGIGDWGTMIQYHEQTQLYFIKWCVDVSFFLIVKMILYNILFGIIVDTFAQLRERKNFRDADRNGMCFICHIDRFKFDKESEGGFSRHISKDHNLWQYVYYIVHLQSKDSSDYSGIESQVGYQYSISDNTWLPRQKALCLEKASEHHEGGEEELVAIMNDVKSKNEIISNFIARTTRLQDKILDAKKKKKQE